MTGQHTPTPWVRRGLALEADKKIIAWIVERFDPKEHNATANFICRAVNAHEELVEALKETLAVAARNEEGDFADRARAALAKAEGQS